MILVCAYMLLSGNNIIIVISLAKYSCYVHDTVSTDVAWCIDILCYCTVYIYIGIHFWDSMWVVLSSGNKSTM